MLKTALGRLVRRMRPGGDPIERCVPDVHHDIYHAFVAMYRFAAPFARGKRVLDAGCGTGYGDLYLCEHRAAKVTGVDVDRSAISYARSHFSHPNLRFECVPSNRYPFPDGSFDVVFSSNAIEHVADHQGYLREVRRVLAPGGVLLLITPVVEVSGQSDHPYHVTNLTPEQWMETLAPMFRHVGCFGDYLRAHPQHTVPWQLSPLVQRLAVHPLHRQIARPVRERIDRDLMFNPFGIWEGDFEVERCEPTTRAFNTSMTFIAVCTDGPVRDFADFEMRRAPRIWTEDELQVARFWRDFRRSFASYHRLFPAPSGNGAGGGWPEDVVWRAIPELWGPRRAVGEFLAPANAITGLRICFATFARENTGTANVRLLTEEGRELAASEADCAQLRDGEFHTVRFKTPVAVRPQERCRFEIWSDDCKTGNAVTVWTRYDCSQFEPGMTCAEAHGAWGGVVHEVLCE
jgi:SAM-dependent methyltransferase